MARPRTRVWILSGFAAVPRARRSPHPMSDPIPPDRSYVATGSEDNPAAVAAG